MLFIRSLLYNLVGWASVLVAATALIVTFWAPRRDGGLQGVPVIGDSLRDLEAAIAAGAQPLLVRTGNGTTTEELLTDKMAFVPVFDDLAAAALHILSEH